MRRKKSEGIFLKQLEHFVNVYMPDSRGLSKNTVLSYKAAFRILILFFYEKKGVPASDITFEMLTLDTLNEFLDWLEKERSCSPLTRNQRLAALYSFSEYAQNRNFEAASCFRMAVIKIPMKKAKGKERAFFTPGEIKILLELPDSESNTGLRDKVLLSVMYASGARAQEICDLRVRDIRFLDGKAILHIMGKGRKARQVQIGKSPAAMLEKYIRRKSLEGKVDRHVFSSQTHEHMSVSCVEAIFQKYVGMAKEAHPGMFKSDSYPPHSMRHTTAVCMLEAGVPLPVIKSFLGHAQLATTEIYASLSQETVNKKVQEWNETYWSHCKAEETVEPANTPEFLLGK
jgi:site-specific recombinase XerD